MNLLKQFQFITEGAKKLKTELAGKFIESAAGGDMVIVKMNGNKEIVSLKISRDVINPNDIEMLSDLIVSAVNEAYRKAQEMTLEELEKLTGGIKLPGISEIL